MVKNGNSNQRLVDGTQPIAKAGGQREKKKRKNEMIGFNNVRVIWHLAVGKEPKRRLSYAAEVGREARFTFSFLCNLGVFVY